MTDFGVTPNGFRRKTADEILADLANRQRATISKSLNVPASVAAAVVSTARGFVGPVNAVLADHLSQIWEATEAAYYASDPRNADDGALEGLAALQGLTKLGPRAGTVLCDITRTPGTPFAAGELIAQVQGEGSNTWTNRDAIPATGGGTLAGVPFVSTLLGPEAKAAAGSLVISQSVSGWLTVTNPLPAITGLDTETPDELEQRRQASLSVQGSATAEGIRSDLLRVPGIVNCTVFHNRGPSVDANGTPPRSIHCVVRNDGADPLAIATTIRDTAPGGVPLHGAQSYLLGDDLIRWTDATQVQIEIDAVVYGALDVSAAKAALVAAVDNTIGSDVVHAKLLAVLVSRLDVRDCPFFEIGILSSFLYAANIPIEPTQFATLSPANISLGVFP